MVMFPIGNSRRTDPLPKTGRAISKQTEQYITVRQTEGVSSVLIPVQKKQNTDLHAHPQN